MFIFTAAKPNDPFAEFEPSLEEDLIREKEKERMRKRQIKATRITLYVFCAMFSGFIGWAFANWGVAKKDEEGNEIVDRFSEYPQPKQIIMRTWDELVNYQASFNSPSRELLLPPPLTYPYIQPPYTLVIELKSKSNIKIKILKILIILIILFKIHKIYLYISIGIFKVDGVQRHDHFLKSFSSKSVHRISKS